MSDWDENSPGDSDVVSQYPSNERDARAAVKGNFGVDHHEADDGDVGKHEAIQLLDQSGDATIDAGDLGIWNDGGVLKTRNGAGGVEQIARISDVGGAAFPSGTKMVFYQAAAPAGWTQDTGVNDQVLKVVSGTGGGTGGSWTISGVTVDNHTLTISQIPAHDHGGTHNTTNDTHNHSGTTNNDTHNHGVPVVGGGDQGTGTPQGHDTTNVDAFRNTTNDTHNHSFSTNNDTHNHSVTIPSVGGGDAHNHGITSDGTWRPSHIDVIVAAKD